MNYCFELTGKPIPQGRPKVAVYGGFPKVYYSASSNAYRKALVAALVEGKARYAASSFPLHRASVSIGAWGMNKNADPDNLAKQILDALVTAGVLEGDEWTHVPRLVVECYDCPSTSRRVFISLETAAI